MAGSVWALLLAAGDSTRMGRPKPLLPWDGATLVEWQIGQLFAAGADGVVVVLGSHAEEVLPLAEGAGAAVVVNDRYREGRASSVRSGAGALPDNAGTIVILNVDQPRPAWVTRGLIEQFGLSGALLAAPSFGDKGGHPLLVAGSLLAELRAVVEETQGLRAVTKRHNAEMVHFPVDISCVIVDLNSPNEYDDALAAFKAGKWDE